MNLSGALFCAEPSPGEGLSRCGAVQSVLGGSSWKSLGRRCKDVLKLRACSVQVRFAGPREVCV